jgi:plastocyanin
VVRRHLGGRGVRATLAVAAVATSPLLLAQPASALNTRVSISNFEWSNKQVHIDLGEKVTWDWLGPDLAHSVTGISPDALGWDSDPTTDAPSHRPGDSYTVQFSQPGTYVFQCKLHSFVRGEVIVSSTPGDPNSDPGPQAPLNIDIVPPTLGGVKLKRTSFDSPKGVRTSARISERGTLDAEYYRLNSKGRRVYNGYATWRAFIGVNHLQLGARGKHFKGRPGRYRAVLRATDEAANTSKPVTKAFTIPG